MTKLRRKTRYQEYNRYRECYSVPPIQSACVVVPRAFSRFVQVLHPKVSLPYHEIVRNVYANKRCKEDAVPAEKAHERGGALEDLPREDEKTDSVAEIHATADVEPAWE